MLLDKDRKFLRAMANISRRWKIEQEKTVLYAILANGRLKPWVGDLDKVMVMRDDENVYKIQLPNLLEEPKFMRVGISTNLFEFPKIEPISPLIVEAKLDAAERALRDYSIMKILLEDVEECDNYTVTYLQSRTLNLTVNVPHYKEFLNISFCLDDECEDLSPSKSILLRSFENFLAHKESGKSEKFSILEEYILTITHLHIKMKTYQTIVTSLQKLQESYNIQEHKYKKTCCVFEIRYGKNNIRLLDFKIDEFSVYFTAYIKPFTSKEYLDSFLPIHIFTKTDVAEVEFIIAKVLEEQKSILNYKQN